ncbi:MAG: hypothetical protein IJH63_10505 [Methanobrevibacter sp.]|nr:hypothetical protein [Methanosphaera sp.]MBR0371131.1 hypothetical protein [Methanobrevibacter sp.]
MLADDLINLQKDYDNLLTKIEDISEDELIDFVKDVFPIFNNAPILSADFILSEDDPFHHGVEYVTNKLGCFCTFRYRDRKVVVDWFKSNGYTEEYDISIGELNFSTYFFYLPVKQLLSINGVGLIFDGR